jgi:hypothetical protein
MPAYEATITFRFRAPSPQVADIYVDGLCTALRYNKPEIDEKSVQWQIQPVQDDLHQMEHQMRPKELLPPDGED